jgi:hypothetical protein
MARKSLFGSVGDFVVAGFAAGQAVKEAIPAQPNIHLRLAKAAVSLAIAAVFGSLTLHAAILVFRGSSGHGGTVAPGRVWGKCRW